LSARQAMTMRADLENNTASGTDAYGNPIPPVWATYATVACRVYSKVRNEVIDEDKTALIETIRALFPLNADVSESYRIANVKDRLGTVLFAGPLAIQTIQRRKDHKEAMLERIQS
jgi:hypothetical protein